MTHPERGRNKTTCSPTPKKVYLKIARDSSHDASNHGRRILHRVQLSNFSTAQPKLKQCIKKNVLSTHLLCIKISCYSDCELKGIILSNSGHVERSPWLCHGISLTLWCHVAHSSCNSYLILWRQFTRFHDTLMPGYVITCRQIT